MILQFAPESEMSFTEALEVPEEHTDSVVIVVDGYYRHPVLVANMDGADAHPGKSVTKTKAHVCKTCGLPIRPLALSKGWGHGASLATVRRATARLGVAFVHDAVPA